MSLPSSGSTAPTITSPLLAWPSLPKTRSPLSTPPSSATGFDHSIPPIYSRKPTVSSSRSLASSLTRSDSWNPVADPKGKGKAVPEFTFDPSANAGDSPDEEPVRAYGPPKQPLSPHQLSRIAQSFGIIVPSLPPPSPSASSPLAGPSRIRHDTSRPSPYLLTVIPPLSLLSLKSISGDEADKRTRKWKRGRLIPLQPTLGGMLAAIAREFGLPNTTGLQVYMGSTSLSSASSAASFSSDDPSGPLISTQSWTALFGHHLAGVSTPRSATPSHTPVKSSGPLGRDIQFPLSPLSLVEKKLEHARTHDKRQRLMSTTSDAVPTAISLRSSDSRLSNSPTSAGHGANPIIGTIEFDLDPELASWYPEYRRSGRYRKSSTSSDNGIRPLRLPQHLSAASPGFMRQRSTSARATGLRNSDGLDGFGSSPDTTLNDHDESYRSNSRESAKDFLAARSRGTEGRRLSVKRAESGGMISTAGSFGEMEETDGYDGRSSGEEARVPGMTLHVRQPTEGQVYNAKMEEEDLLASPIMLDGLLTPVGAVKATEGDDKRGSAMVMSEQLDDLERIMRQLSPRDIRLTSPRMLTPRMAAKVATNNLQFPVDLTAKRNPTQPTVTSSLGREATFPARNPSAAASTATVNTIATQSSVPSFDATTLSRPPLEAEYSDAGLPAPSWPAVPFAKLSESPGSPGSIHDYFRQPTGAVIPLSPISTETLTRMRPPSPDQLPSQVPRRPNRPPSPDLSDHSIPHHSLPAEYVDHLNQARSSPGQSTPASPGPARLKSRSGSISLKGLKHMSSKNFGWKRSEQGQQPPPALPLLPRTASDTEAVGLFGHGDKISPKESTFPSVGRSVSSSQPSIVGEFGQVTEPTGQAATMPTKGSKEHSFSRWMNPFGNKKSSVPPDSPKSASFDKDRGSKHSKRHPSVGTIGSPVSGSLKRHAQPGHATSPSLSSTHSQGRPSLPGLSSSTTTHTMSTEPDESGGPISPRMLPNSPRSVKRKPVPLPLGEMPVRNSEDEMAGGMKGSMSMGSVASYTVGEERKPQVPLGVRVG